jgi:ribosome biogenesis GTPase
MENIGLSERFVIEALEYPGLHVGRVVSQLRDCYRVLTENGECSAEISGKFRFQAKSLPDFPAVGDFVMLDRKEDDFGKTIIHHVLTRKSAFIRKAAGTSKAEQVVASNIDTVFICMSLNKDFNLRRVERYLGIAWASGAVPVIVLTKADLPGADVQEKLPDLEKVACGVDVVVTSSLREEGGSAIRAYLGRGKTVAFIGSSGVGKSTLINRLFHREVLPTGEIRGDDRGRHTTTRRDLLILPDGGAVIDTPGMREIGIETADFGSAFADIEEFAAQCRFNDCTHTREPGCAVQQAIREGRLSAERLSSYLKLQKEAKYEGLNSRQIEAEKIEAMFAEVGGIKNARKLAKAKNDREFPGACGKRKGRHSR